LSWIVPGIVALGALVTGCQLELDELDGVFYDGDNRLVHCGVNLDTSARTSLASIDGGLDRARDRGEVIELYAHHPGDTVPIATLEHVLAGAQQRGLAFYTYADFAHGRAIEPGLALSFDDTSVQAWYDLRPLLDRHAARVTFFVSRYYNIHDEQREQLRQLADDGHDIAAHSVQHMRAPDYVEAHGLNAYLHDEVDPSIGVLRDAGYDITSFAYPFGARTGELDRAIGKRVGVLRSVAFTYGFVGDPCPR
jgi:hypothetical protein